MSKKTLTVVMIFTASLAIVGCGTAKKKLIGTWVKDGPDYLRFDPNGQMVEVDTGLYRFAGAWHMEGKDILVKSVLSFKFNFTPSGQMAVDPQSVEYPDYKYRIDTLDATNLVLINIESGDVVRYRRTDPGFIKWQPPVGPEGRSFELTMKSFSRKN